MWREACTSKVRMLSHKQRLQLMLNKRVLLYIAVNSSRVAQGALIQ